MSRLDSCWWRPGVGTLSPQRTSRLEPKGCSSSETFYLEPEDQPVFRGWSPGPKSPCMKLKSGGLYAGRYTHEVLVTVASDLPQFRRSDWITPSSVVDIEAPEQVSSGNRARFEFQGWDLGGTPYLPQNRVAVLEPLTLELP